MLPEPFTVSLCWPLDQKKRQNEHMRREREVRKIKTETEQKIYLLRVECAVAKSERETNNQKRETASHTEFESVAGRTASRRSTSPLLLKQLICSWRDNDCFKSLSSLPLSRLSPSHELNSSEAHCFDQLVLLLHLLSSIAPALDANAAVIFHWKSLKYKKHVMSLNKRKT